MFIFLSIEGLYSVSVHNNSLSCMPEKKFSDFAICVLGFNIFML